MYAKKQVITPQITARRKYIKMQFALLSFALQKYTWNLNKE